MHEAHVSCTCQYASASRSDMATTTITKVVSNKNEKKILSATPTEALLVNTSPSLRYTSSDYINRIPSRKHLSKPLSLLTDFFTVVVRNFCHDLVHRLIFSRLWICLKIVHWNCLKIVQPRELLWQNSSAREIYRADAKFYKMRVD